MGGKLVPDSQFKFFTHYHHLKVSKVADSVFDPLRFYGKLRYQTEEGGWFRKEARVVQDDGVSENYVSWQLLDEPNHEVAILSANEVGWMVVEIANFNLEDDIEKRQRDKSKLWLGASYVYVEEITAYDVKRFDVVLSKPWMVDTNRPYQVDHDSNEIWIANNRWEEWKQGQVHYLPRLRPLDVNDEIVEQAIIMGIHMIQKAELKNVSAHLRKWAFFIKVHHPGDGDNLLTDELPGEFQEILTEFQRLFSEPSDANLQKGRYTMFEITMDLNSKIRLHVPWRISPR